MLFLKFKTNSLCPCCRKGYLIEKKESRDTKCKNGKLFPLGLQKVIYCEKCSYGYIIEEW